MAKVAKKNSAASFVLELVASLVLVGIIWMWGSTASAWTLAQTLLYAAGVVASVVLFIVSFSNLAMGGMSGAAMKATIIAAFAAIFLFGQSTQTLIAILGLLLGLVGAWMGM